MKMAHKENVELQGIKAGQESNEPEPESETVIARASSIAMSPLLGTGELLTLWMV